MMKFKNIVVSILMAFMTLSITACANDVENIEDSSEIAIEAIDDLLREAGTPEDKIQAMDEELKHLIYEKSLLQDTVEYVEVTIIETLEDATNRDSTISEEDLQLSVAAFKVDGAEQIDIYPSYKWNIPVEPKGKDFFGYAADNLCYRSIPQIREGHVYYKMSSDDAWTEAPMPETSAVSFTGYEYRGDDLGTSDSPIYLKGDFYYRVNIYSDSETNIFAMAYVHDTSYGSDYGYSISYNGFSPINVYFSSDNVSYMSNVYTLNY